MLSIIWQENCKVAGVGPFFGQQGTLANMRCPKTWTCPFLHDFAVPLGHPRSASMNADACFRITCRRSGIVRRRSNGRRDCMGKEACQTWQEGVAMNRLGQVGVASSIQTLLLVPNHGVCREGDNRSAVPGLTQSVCGLVAVHDGHVHVHENQVIGHALGKRAESFFAGTQAVVGDRHFAARSFQKPLDQTLIVRSVLGQENPSIQANRLGICTRIRQSLRCQRRNRSRPLAVNGS